MKRLLALALLVVPSVTACGGSTDSGDRDAGLDAAAPHTDTGAPSSDTAVAPTRDSGPPAVRCGDLTCARGEETCETCPADCGECPTCDMAPTCTGALAVPTSAEPLAGCDNTMGEDERTNYACGTDLGVAPGETTCADPQLRIRVREIAIERGFFDIPRNLYCVITAEDGTHSELLITPLREVAGNRNTTTLNLPLAEALFWGQGDLYRSISNLTITYACSLSSDVEATRAALDAIADRAGDAAEHADGYGWVFGAAAVLGEIIGSSLGAVSDDRILDVQQTIDAGALLEMTNGRQWEIREHRGNLDLSGASDLRLTLESWGCADVRTTFD
ncbi:MAG: hypothetical protein IT379_12745 [Deltaproteobacteria bacterium]|nr:hypothetical protein [Deltaproteobacteria bacterium]